MHSVLRQRTRVCTELKQLVLRWMHDHQFFNMRAEQRVPKVERMEPPTKRRCDHPEWSIRMDDASGLRSILDAVSAVTQRVIFRVMKNEESGNYQLKFDGADVGMTCCVSARLQIDNVVLHVPQDDDQFVFCVDCKQMHLALDNPSCSHGSLLLQYFTDGTIHCRMQDPEQPSHADCSKLNTFVDGSEPIKLNDLEFDMKLEIDLSKLREMVKKATKCHSEHLRIQIFLRKGNGPNQQSLVVFSVKGDAYFCQQFCHETSRDDDGSLRVRAVADGETNIIEDAVDPEYEAVFPVEKMNAFIRVLPCRMIVATIKQGMPLMMTYRLGGGIASSAATDESSVKFLIASINESD